MSTLKVNTILNTSGGTIELDNTLKAWLHFNGSGTPSIGADYNISSITDNGTGYYTMNFSSSFSDANYALAGWAKDSNNGGNITIVGALSGHTLTSSACPIYTRETSAQCDPADASVLWTR